jgi:protein-tyrosine phosphatase
MPARFSVLMVCLGNICRSPTAEGVLRHLVREARLDDAVLVDSAGMADYHVGSPPDSRSCAHAARRGYDLSMLRARQLQPVDFRRFDLILAMDWDNLQALQEECPAEHRHKLRRLMEFAPPGVGEVVADPYYAGREGFEAVLDQVEQACAGLLIHLRETAGRGR